MSQPQNSDAISRHTPAEKRLRRLEWIGTRGLLVFGLGLVAGPDLIPVGRTMMLLALVGILPAIWKPLVLDKLLRLSLIFVGFICLYTIYLEWGPKPALTDHFQGLNEFLLTGFLPAILVAIWWARLVDQGRSAWPIWAFVAGFYIRLATQWPQEDWSQGIPTKIGFGLYYNPFSMFCALVMAWWLVVVLNLNQSVRRRPLIVAAIALAFSLPLLGWLNSLSRGGMLAFLAAIPLILFLEFRHHRASKKQLRGVAALIILIVVAGLVWLGGPMMDRFTREKGDITAFLEQGAENFTPERVSSIGTRMVIWREGVKLWLEKPLLGHGPGPTRYFIEPLRKQYRIDRPTDFESTYLELLVRLGLVGALFYLLHLSLCLNSFSHGNRSAWLPAQTSHFLAAATLIFAIAILFREGLLDPRGRNFASFLLGGLYAFHAARLWKPIDNR